MKFVKVALITVVVVGLAASLASVGAAREKSILRKTEAWPTYIDPAVGSDYSSSMSIINLYDSLIYPLPGGDLAPHLAESWQISPDGLTYTFKLRQGIKFHCGGELTAEDVKFSMERLLTIGEGYAYLFIGKVERVEVLDTYTVQFKLTAPYGPFLYSLIRFYIVCKDCVMANIKKPGLYGEFGDYGKEWLLTNACGTGAYRVKEVRLEEYVLMERFPDYWGYVAPRAPDLVKFLVSPDPVTVKTMMARRELEITDQWVPEEVLQAIEAIPGVKRAGWFDGGSHYLMLHNRKPPTDCVHFRRALSYMLDYQAIEAIFPGVKQSRGPVSRVLPGHHAGVYQYRRDLDKAREELRKSKYYDQLDRVTVTYFWTAEVPDLEKIALLFMVNAAELGINVEVVKTPWLKMIEVTADIEATPNVMSIWVAPHYPEAGSQLETKYHSRNAGTWEQAEWVLDPVLDAMIDDALATVDRDERFRKYALIQEYVVERAISIFAFDAFEKHAYQAAYVNWPQATNPSPVMGYNIEARFIEVFPERIPKG